MVRILSPPPSLPRMYRFTDPALGMSLEAPGTWRGEKQSAGVLRFVAPWEDGYRARLTVEMKKLDPPAAASGWFAGTIERTYARGEIGLEGYELVESFDFALDGRPAFMARYRSAPSRVGRELAHLDALALLTGDEQLEIRCVGTLRLEPKYLPIFVHVVDSMRFGRGAPDLQHT